MMLTKNLFKKPGNPLEWYDGHNKNSMPDIPDQMCISCPQCKAILLTGDLNENARVCPKCGYHFRMNARLPTATLFGKGTRKCVLPI